jgi:hypothetical protein
MQTLMRPVVRYLNETTRAFAEGWDTFWFRPADPTLLGAIRICAGLMLLYTHAVWSLALTNFFGTHGWLSPELVRAMQADESSYSFWWAVPSWGVWPVHLAALAVIALFTAGLWTRVTSLLSLLIAISYAHRVPVAMFGLDQMNVMLTLYLTVGGSGAALSLDRLRAVHRGAMGRPTPSVLANIAIRLIQIHMCVIYFFAGTSKLMGPAWWNGQAMWLAFSNLEYQSMNMTWLAWHPKLVNLATHVTILWEVFFCVLIWLPRIRPLVLAGAVMTHTGIGLCLGMWTFGLVMLIGNMAFLPPEGIRKLVDSLKARRKATPSAALRAPTTPPSPAGWVDRIEGREPVLAAEGGQERL